MPWATSSAIQHDKTMIKTTIALAFVLLAACTAPDIDNVITSVTQNNMALPDTNIDIAAIRTTLGEDSDDLNHLYFSPNINQWAAFKPHNGAASAMASGLKRQATAPYKCYWDKPLTANGFNIGHFRSYNHAATPPVNVALTDVRLVDGPSIWNGGNPILLKDGFYRFYFNFQRGDCNPQAIDNATGWTKLTTGNGSSGIVWMEDDTKTVFDASEVYSVTTTPTSIDQVMQIKSAVMPFYIYYATLQSGVYGKTKLIENSYPLLPDNTYLPWYGTIAILDNYVEWMTDEQDGDAGSNNGILSQMRWTDVDDFVTGTWFVKFWLFNVTTQQVVTVPFVYKKWKIDDVWDTSFTTQALDAYGVYEGTGDGWIEYHNNILHDIPNLSAGNSYQLIVTYYDTTGLLNASKQYNFTR